jgi:hypothetical protein
LLLLFCCLYWQSYLRKKLWRNKTSVSKSFYYYISVLGMCLFDKLPFLCFTLSNRHIRTSFAVTLHSCHYCYFRYPFRKTIFLPFLGYDCIVCDCNGMLFVIYIPSKVNLSIQQQIMRRGTRV